jgi:hypothetical protein
MVFFELGLLAVRLGCWASCQQTMKIQVFILNLNIMTYQVDILNPKADKLLKDLADLKLISLTVTSNDPFLTEVKRLRKKAAGVKAPTLDEITKEVESVRAKRYGNRKKA